jgi:hypothetical protein
VLNRVRFGCGVFGVSLIVSGACPPKVRWTVNVKSAKIKFGLTGNWVLETGH